MGAETHDDDEEDGSADIERETLGFAAKSYTEDGNNDIVGNTTLVFVAWNSLKSSDFTYSETGPMRDL